MTNKKALIKFEDFYYRYIANSSPLEQRLAPTKRSMREIKESIIPISIFAVGSYLISIPNLSLFALSISLILLISSIINICAITIRQTCEASLDPFLSYFNLKNKKKKSFTIDEFKEIGLFPKGNSLEEYATFISTIKQVSFEFADLIISHITTESNIPMRYTDYKGIIIKIKLNKTFDYIFIKEFDNKYQNNKNENFIDPNSKIYETKNLNLYSEELNERNFNFYTDNYEQAKKFLHTALYTKLETIDSNCKTKSMNYAVYKDTLYIFLHENFNKHPYFKKHGENVCNIAKFEYESNLAKIKEENIYKYDKTTCEKVFMELYEIRKILNSYFY